MRQDNSPEKISFEKRLVRILLISSGAGVLVMGLVFAVYDGVSGRSQAVRHLEVVGKVVGHYAAADFAAGRMKASGEELMALYAPAEVTAAGIYDTEKHLRAGYRRTGNRFPFPHPDWREPGAYFESGSLLVFQPLKFEGRTVGTLYIQSDWEKLHPGWVETGIYVFLVLGISLGAAWLVGKRLIRPVTSRVQKLAASVETVLAGRNPALLNRLRGEDELGILVRSLEDLLHRLQESGQKLEQHRKHLREQVAFRAAEIKALHDRALRAREEVDLASQSKSVFLANLSHELRTPLNAILGYSEMLQEEAEDAGREDLIPDLRKISQSGKYMLGWVDEILDLSRIESGRAELRLDSFDAAGLVRDVEADIQPELQQSRNTLEVVVQEDPGAIRADRERVRRVLLNLLKNACKFAPGGTLTLGVERVEIEGTAWMNFSVTDSGAGIPPELLNDLFRNYTQSDASLSTAFGAAALGLAICQRFSLLMGGNIIAESELGEGAVYTFRLPCQVDLQLRKSHVLRGTNRLIRDLLKIGEEGTE